MSEQCQGKSCPRKTKCERYVTNWPFPVASKLCDGRYVAFLPKTHIEQRANTVAERSTLTNHTNHTEEEALL